MTRETCQAGCREVQVDDRGRVSPHFASEAASWNGIACQRSRHPSREELARRKASRDECRRALADGLRNEAAIVLDVLLTGRDDADASRLLTGLDEIRGAALYDYNRRNKTRHRKSWRWRGSSSASGCILCIFCDEVIEDGVFAHPFDIKRAALRAGSHLTQCALEYLAGLRGQETNNGR